jgi:enoyl-CoA hydratase/carnithine racemase
MPSELITERRGSALVLTISDPSTRNTLSGQVIAAGIEALGASESNDAVRAVVVRGQGAAFCAGGMQAIRAYPKPVLACVEGTAAGAGFSLALACDMIVAASDARFVMSYARIGLTPDGGATWGLAASLPRALALEMLWLARPASAETLHAHGLVAEIAPAGQAIDAALALCERLAAMAPNALAAVKELVEGARGRSFAAQLDAERDAFLDSLFHANGEEGLSAFLGKRPPRFS